MSSQVCRWPVKRPSTLCIGQARYETLYSVEYIPPERKDYHPPKTGGGWHRSASRQVYRPTPYKMDQTLYSIEYSRIKVPGQSDYEPLRKRLFIKEEEIKKPEKPKKKCDREEDGSELEDDFQQLLNVRGKCCHSEHKRPISKLENPTRYPYSLFDPNHVDYDRPLTPQKPPVKTYPKRVTEDDIRNNPPREDTNLLLLTDEHMNQGWKGTKGFYTPGTNGRSSESGLAAAGRYYQLVRPLEGTLLAMNANRSIKSAVMC